MKYKDKFIALKKYAKMETEEDVRLFDRTVYELAGTQIPEVLEKLIDIFDDNCEYPEVMFSLVHAIETYNDKVYVYGLLRKVKNFEKYPGWFTDLVYRIFNSEHYKELFKQNIRVADQVKLKQLLKLMYQESESHRPIIEDIINSSLPEYSSEIEGMQRKAKKNDAIKFEEARKEKERQQAIVDMRGELWGYIYNGYRGKINADGLFKDFLNGGEEFAKEFLQQHRSEIFLNYCPNCSHLKKTPKARQCLKCGEFHDPKINT